MPEDTGKIETEEIYLPIEVPTDQHEAGSRISQVGRYGRKYQKTALRYDKRITKTKAQLQKRIDALTKEKEATLAAIEKTGGHFGNEMMEYLKRCWKFLTKNGSMKTAKFWAGEVALRNLPDRVVVTNVDAFLAEARRKGKAKLLITRGPERPNLTALGDNIELARTFKTVTIEEKSTVTITPRFGWGLLFAVVPRKMSDRMEIHELLEDAELNWNYRKRNDT